MRCFRWSLESLHVHQVAGEYQPALVLVRRRRWAERRVSRARAAAAERSGAEAMARECGGATGMAME